jgi:hypothetical protein
MHAPSFERAEFADALAESLGTGSPNVKNQASIPSVKEIAFPMKFRAMNDLSVQVWPLRNFTTAMLTVHAAPPSVGNE